jgi:hypothetical protein
MWGGGQGQRSSRQRSDPFARSLTPFSGMDSLMNPLGGEMDALERALQDMNQTFCGLVRIETLPDKTMRVNFVDMDIYERTKIDYNAETNVVLALLAGTSLADPGLADLTPRVRGRAPAPLVRPTTIANSRVPTAHRQRRAPQRQPRRTRVALRASSVLGDQHEQDPRRVSRRRLNLRHDPAGRSGVRRRDQADSDQGQCHLERRRRRERRSQRRSDQRHDRGGGQHRAARSAGRVSGAHRPSEGVHLPHPKAKVSRRA